MYKILFADDDRKISEAVSDYFTANGFSVTLAKNGEQAVEQAYESAFDLIILDVMMPVLDGISACKETKSFILMDYEPNITVNYDNDRLPNCFIKPT